MGIPMPGLGDNMNMDEAANEFAPVQSAMDKASVRYEQTGDIRATLDELIAELATIKNSFKDLGGLGGLTESPVPGNGEE